MDGVSFDSSALARWHSLQSHCLFCHLLCWIFWTQHYYIVENPPCIVTKYAARLHKYQQASTPSGQKLKYETACFAPLYRWISGHRMPLKFRLALARKHTSAYFNLWLDGVKLSHGIFFSEARVLLYKLWLALLSVIQYKALISEGMEIQMNKM